MVCFAGGGAYHCDNLWAYNPLHSVSVDLDMVLTLTNLRKRRGPMPYLSLVGYISHMANWPYKRTTTPLPTFSYLYPYGYLVGLLWPRAHCHCVSECLSPSSHDPTVFKLYSKAAYNNFISTHVITTDD